MSDFEDRSGIVEQSTPWGRWYQSLSDVTIEVNLQPPAKGKDVKVLIKPRRLECKVRGETIFQGELCATIVEDESTWTIEDGKLLRILLVKVGSSKDYWESLLVGQFAPDPLTLLEMRKKLDLERFQVEHPGFDFSGAQLDKKYQDFPGLDAGDLNQAAGLSNLQMTNNKTDDEKLLEQEIHQNPVTDDMKTESDLSKTAERLSPGDHQ